MAILKELVCRFGEGTGTNHLRPGPRRPDTPAPDSPTSDDMMASPHPDSPRPTSPVPDLATGLMVACF
jgi:hypothetical protein